MLNNHTHNNPTLPTRGLNTINSMKKRILVLTFADHLTDAQVEAIANTHKNATGLYSDARLIKEPKYKPGNDQIICVSSERPTDSDDYKKRQEIVHKILQDKVDIIQGWRDLITDEPVFESAPHKSRSFEKDGTHYVNDIATEFNPPESDPITEMSKHFAPDVWANIVKNYDPSYGFKGYIDEACKATTCPNAFLIESFNWRNSPEGWRYWKDLHHSIINITDKPQTQNR